MKQRSASGFHPQQTETADALRSSGLQSGVLQFGHPVARWDRWSDCQVWPDCLEADDGGSPAERPRAVA
ncbi:hypothetical protein ACIPY3_10435 [Paenarthrobacter sp. NPDC089714]|uniref:hypothetical protein n=1 Tax=unclassified Paenarthrobacter TaxID=2634190 RepID=UPI0038066730